MSGRINFTNVFLLSFSFAFVAMCSMQASCVQAQTEQIGASSKSGVTFNFRSESPQVNQPLAKLRQQDPSGLLKQNAPLPEVDGNANYASRQNRFATATVANWSQPNLRHRRLFFEDAATERSNEPRKYGNLASGMHFFKSLFRLPLRVASGR